MKSEHNLDKKNRRMKKSLIIEQMSEEMRSGNSLRKTPQFLMMSGSRMIDLRVISEFA
jgi:hypothetical protein